MQSDERKAELLDSATAHALQIEGYCRMGWALAKVAPHLDEVQWERVALRVLDLPLKESSDRQWRAHAVCSLLREHGDAQKSTLVDEVLETVEGLDDGGGITDLLTWAVPFMTEQQLERTERLASRDNLAAFNTLQIRAAVAGRLRRQRTLQSA